MSARQLFQHAWVVQVSSCLVYVQYSTDEKSFDLDGVMRVAHLPFTLVDETHRSCQTCILSQSAIGQWSPLVRR